SDPPRHNWAYCRTNRNRVGVELLSLVKFLHDAHRHNHREDRMTDRRIVLGLIGASAAAGVTGVASAASPRDLAGQFAITALPVRLPMKTQTIEIAILNNRTSRFIWVLRLWANAG